ncbi:conserved hypothetical protein [Frankia canadensis]|uniref:Asp23/Gls24 family envelope stress response protein n=1 Tax=Frankia canadensis TaxID=1836972 RepID=A0A2I2L118_9ACTN|nr:hypothetical protein [Frankia canadensis]SNQ51600.1 conserved hypothetical protein [Frankia canadensis]SOU58890.1 conserved hypothetical protein [Frankia canadensis]
MSPARTGGGDHATWLPWDPDEVARAALACAGVARLVATPAPVRPHPAPAAAAEVATYLPGRRVEGVRVRPDGIAVQVECHFGERLAGLAERVREAVLAAAPGCPRVDVLIGDLVPGPDGSS